MLNPPMLSSNDPSRTSPDSQPLTGLCLGVLPVWERHLATSRSQSEVAVTQMLKAFADIGPHIDLAERQSQQITEALSQCDAGVSGLTRACERVLAPVLADPLLPATAVAAMGEVLGMVRRAVDALENIAKPFAHETQMVAEQVDRMYMGFQYQDRISQMMALIEGDIARLYEAFATGGVGAPALSDWLVRLESQYAMTEQHRDHQAKDSGDPGNDSNNETTFF